MSATPLISAEQLRLALTKATYMALFDEEQTGVVADVDESLIVTQVRRRAHIKCVAWLGANYSKIPDGADDSSEISYLLVDAELNYAMAMAFDMHPEYVREYGEGYRRKAAFEQAELCMMRVQEAILKLVDVPSVGNPANVGGIVTDSGQRMFLGSTNGALNSGDF